MYQHDSASLLFFGDRQVKRSTAEELWVKVSLYLLLQRSQLQGWIKLLGFWGEVVVGEGGQAGQCLIEREEKDYGWWESRQRVQRQK